MVHCSQALFDLFVVAIIGVLVESVNSVTYTLPLYFYSIDLWFTWERRILLIAQVMAT